MVCFLKGFPLLSSLDSRRAFSLGVALIFQDKFVQWAVENGVSTEAQVIGAIQECLSGFYILGQQEEEEGPSHCPASEAVFVPPVLSSWGTLCCSCHCRVEMRSGGFTEIQFWASIQCFEETNNERRQKK